jgi:hypothetical protein
MMSRQFLLEKLQLLVVDFPMIKCSYRFDKLSNTHLIEVVPDSIFNVSSEYSLAEEDVTFEFIRNFPDEGICFITDTSFTKIGEPEAVFEGANYGKWCIIEEDSFIAVSCESSWVMMNTEEWSTQSTDAGDYQYAMAA